MRLHSLVAALAVLGGLGGASTTTTHPDEAPMLLQSNRTIHVEKSGIYCTVLPLVRVGNDLYCYDVRDRFAGSYGIEFSSSQLTVLRFAEADKAHIVWARREP